MNWLWDLLTDERSVATAIFALAITIVLGLALGGLRCRGISLGIAGVLFSGLCLGHVGIAIRPEVAEFAQEFGLVLFVYAVGTAVGPGFVNAFRRFGAKTNFYAAAVVVGGAILAWTGVVLIGIAPPIAVGILAGATTNTPSLAAAGSMLAEYPPDDEDARSALRQIGVADATLPAEFVRSEVGKLPGLAYAVTYPGGVVGIILAFLILKRLFHVDPAADARRLEQRAAPDKAPLEHRLVRVTQADCAGTTADALPQRHGSTAVISRIRRGDKTFVCLGDTPIQSGDVLRIVGTADDLE